MKEAQKMTCRYFETCSAPICPLSDTSMKNCTWFADEEVCRVMGFPFVRRQAKIKKLGLGVEDGCFTVAMLERKCVAGRGMKGLDPDDFPFDEQEKKWMKAHPEIIKREFTPEQLKRLSDRLEKGRSAGKERQETAVSVRGE